MNQVKLVVFVLVAMSYCVVAKAEDRVLFNFEGPEDSEAWYSVNDEVMGGVSEGSFRINEDNCLEFFGELSLENNGGFTSVRTRGSHLALERDESVVLRVRGDGRPYNFNLYTQGNRYSFRQSFATVVDEWVEVTLPVALFAATWRGREFPDVEFDPAAVTGAGILLGDGKPGDFKLEIDWIKVVDGRTPSPE